MEDKKKTNQRNNATEKVENIVEENTVTPAEEIKREIEQESKKIADKTVNERKSKLSALEKREQKVQKELERAKIRENRAQNKIEKKMKKMQSLDDKKAAWKQRKLDHKEKMLKAKEARLERKEMLRNETYAEKMERIAREKQAKQDAKARKHILKGEKREQRAELRREKLQARREMKSEKRRLRLENRRDKRSRGIGGWLAAVIALGCSVLVLGTLFTISLATNKGGDGMFESEIEKTFYDLVSYVDNMEVNMSKLLVSNDSREQQKILGELEVQANLAAADMSELPLRDESKFYTTKYINQVGDYAKYLDNKLIDGGKLSAEDKDTLEKLYNVNVNLKSGLSELVANIDENYQFISLMSDGSDNVVLDSFVSFEEGAVDYPQMIYDGPFSDGLDVAKVRGLTDKEVSKTEAVEKFKAIFKDYNFDRAEVIGETDGKIAVYNIEGDYDDKTIFAQISKNGGKLVMFNNFADCDEKAESIEKCVDIADEFIKNLGIENMKAVWSSESAANVYVNYAFNQNGVIVYPDMIKVTVCEERGIVSSFDATEYYLNHTERKIGKAKISKEAALKNMSQNLNVENVRLALIPLGNSKEVLTYEVNGTFGGSTYYVYVNAETGKEVQIFKVVQTTEGNLLI